MTIERDTIPRQWPFLSPLGDKPGEAMPQEVDYTGPNRDRMQYPTPNTDPHYESKDREDDQQ